LFVNEHSGAHADSDGPELSIIVPTFNERDNVAPMVGLLDAALAGIAWEVIFVDDDSPDGTADEAKRLALIDRRVRCILRVGRRGLAGATIEGMLASSAPYVAVIDGDLQHDERILPEMLGAVREAGCDLVVATRLREGDSITGLSDQRSFLSDFGRFLAGFVIRSKVSDPMSGFFMVRRSIVEALAPKLATEGFKILADILATSPKPLATREVGYVFRERQHGESKLDARVAFDYIAFLIHHLTGRLIPIRFFMFGMVGASGVVVHLVTLKLVLEVLPSAGFDASQLIATFVAMLSNFLLNNQLTYRDRRHKGWRIIPNFLLFAASCSVGLIANIGLASMIYADQPTWWIAGLAGALIGTVFNYATSSLLVWRKKT
jgi:dolichol-phosphate mannosyltransferase